MLLMVWQGSNGGSWERLLAIMSQELEKSPFLTKLVASFRRPVWVGSKTGGRADLLDLGQTANLVLLAWGFSLATPVPGVSGLNTASVSGSPVCR